MSEFWIRFTDDERIEGPFSVAELVSDLPRGLMIESRLNSEKGSTKLS